MRSSRLSRQRSGRSYFGDFGDFGDFADGDFDGDESCSYFDASENRRGGPEGSRSSIGEGGGGRALGAVCCAFNACLVATGLLAACGSVLLQLRTGPAAAAVTACCCRPLLPLDGGSLPLACLLAACLPLAAGLLGLAAAVHRRARVGHAGSALATVCCAIVAANAGVLAGASGGGSDLAFLLEACGLLDAAAAGHSSGGWSRRRLAVAALAIGCGSSVVLLAHACLSCTYYYKYASVGSFDGQYSVAKVRRRRWRRWRQLQQQQQEQLLAASGTFSSGQHRGPQRPVQHVPLAPLQGRHRFELLEI